MSVSFVSILSSTITYDCKYYVGTVDPVLLIKNIICKYRFTVICVSLKYRASTETKQRCAPSSLYLYLEDC